MFYHLWVKKSKNEDFNVVHKTFYMSFQKLPANVVKHEKQKKKSSSKG